MAKKLLLLSSFLFFTGILLAQKTIYYLDIQEVSRNKNAVKIQFELAEENSNSKSREFYPKLYLYHKYAKKTPLHHFYLENTDSKYITAGTHTIFWNFAMEKISLNGDYHFGIELIPKSRKYLGWVISGLGLGAITTYFLVTSKDPDGGGEVEESKILPAFDQTP